MKPTDELIHEHEAIQTMLQILESACSRLSAGGNVNTEHLEKMVEFLRVFADKCHHAKEETALFPALEAAGVPREHGPIGVMLAEHTAGRKHIQGMSAALDGLRNGGTTAAGEFVSNARAYINLLTQHIAKENHVLFPLADNRLSESEQQRLTEAFARLEREQIGEGTHERLHALLHEFQHLYLVTEKV